MSDLHRAADLLTAIDRLTDGNLPIALTHPATVTIPGSPTITVTVEHVSVATEHRDGRTEERVSMRVAGTANRDRFTGNVVVRDRSARAQLRDTTAPGEVAGRVADVLSNAVCGFGDADLLDLVEAARMLEQLEDIVYQLATMRVPARLSALLAGLGAATAASIADEWDGDLADLAATDQALAGRDRA